MGADLALFPEMWNNGYRVTADPAQLEADAVPRDGAFVRAFANLAKELEMAIGITFLERFNPAPRNTLCVFDRMGDCVLTYAKVHTCDFDVERSLTPGEDFYSADLDTGRGSVRIGAMICYDREFPESARILMLQGRRLSWFPTPAPCRSTAWRSCAPARMKIWQGCHCQLCLRPADCNGHSSAFDGIAYRDGEGGERDMLLLDAGEAEGIYLASFPLAELRAYRENEVHGNAYRHPGKYKLLVAEERKAPFVRADYRG
ncbi:MAG: carbon-nitrogen hydrolase family protein [Hydrogeniiclostridium mannosilyticum]